jgi:hypothetical protein
MIYLIEFDMKPGSGQKQIAETYQRFADHCGKTLPKFKLIGLFARDLFIGGRPQYLALWEFSSYADLDAWNRAWATDEEGKRLARELGELAENWDAKVLAKLL